MDWSFGLKKEAEFLLYDQLMFLLKSFIYVSRGVGLMY